MLNEKEFLDFVYIGAPRAGSTWLAAVLDQHPDVWIPHNKELHFFNDRLIYTFEYKYPKGIEFYKRYFSEAPENVKLGELSPFYYYDPNAAYRIHKYFPNVKIIVTLRDPVEVVYSMYFEMKAREPRATSFEKELLKNPKILDLGFYHRLLTPYFDWFPKENIYIQVFEDFFANEETALKNLLRYLDINQDFIPTVLGKRVNVSKVNPSTFRAYTRGAMLRILNTKSAIPIKEFLHKLKFKKMDYSGSDKPKDNKNSKPPLGPKLRELLFEQFEPDVQRLEKLLNIDLNKWRIS